MHLPPRHLPRPDALTRTVHALQHADALTAPAQWAEVRHLGLVIYPIVTWAIPARHHRRATPPLAHAAINLQTLIEIYQRRAYDGDQHAIVLILRLVHRYAITLQRALAREAPTPA